MEHAFSVFMLIFAGALFFYAALMAITKDYKMLPYRARVSVKPKNPEKYMIQLAKIVALAALAIAAGAAVALWNNGAGAAVMLAGVIAVLCVSPKLFNKEM